MKDKTRKSFICQSCGALTDARMNRCGICGRNPVIQTACNVADTEQGGGNSNSKTPGRAAGEYEAVRDQIELVFRENRTLGNVLSGLERELMVTKAGFETLLGELGRRKVIDKEDFILKWSAQVRTDLKGVRLKEMFLSKKWEFLGEQPVKGGARFRSLLDEAESCFSALEWEKAYASLASAERMTGNGYSLTIFMARFAIETGRSGDAERYSKKALTESPVPMEALKLAALSNMISGRQREAGKLVDRWIREAGESYEPLLFKAYMKASAGSWKEAGKWCEKAIEMDEGLIPHLILAFSLLRQEKRGPAKKVLEKALSFYPASPEIRHMQHALHLLNGSRDEAVTVRSAFPEREDVDLCRKREKLLSANKLDSFFETVEPDIEMVLSDLNAGRPVTA